jgi:peptidoglycan/LPS O-acetylase OafA/YrhL
VLAVAAVILLLQLAIASLLGISPSHAFPRLRGELLGFVSLALGYMSLYLEERILRRFRVWLGFGVNLAVYACLFTIVSPVLGLETPAPGIAFIAGALARLLQTTRLRGAWYFATAFPTVAACLNAGRLLSIDDETPLWTAVLVRWIGLTVACYFLTLLSRNHQRRSPLVQNNHNG